MGKTNLFRDFVNKRHLLLPLSFVSNFVTLDGRCLQERFISGRGFYVGSDAQRTWPVQLLDPAQPKS